ncbi:DUF862-domain-containing protein [Wolfiporia cocos MD-104 SS10]|uniref:DUF862-domain-containing protein n=1 Tax=Wolfiporia cocos (strain MD-104) TaxID=742152 RepID=A0A2H3JDG8_WOLCO|nr:DUF862-domain-containing protein [Wolfiporia cocos MD-104 SS10]
MSKVELYVYDLSNGLAKQLSRQLTGKQIDGIWHTSVVVFGREIFYGQGVCETLPGQSHHGKPLQIVDMGETALDQDTFNEYLTEMRQHYTADKYHLLEFNCNSFTNDCVGFLTGGSIPSWISDLPSDFLSTPFGAALRPTIDAMFRRPVPGAAPTLATLRPSPADAAAAISASPNPGLAASLLQAVASQAFSPTAPASSGSAAPSAPPLASSSTVSAPIHICTNPSSLHSLLRTHKAVIVFFTSTTCGPCRMVEPVFEDLAYAKTHRSGKDRTAFVKVDMDVGLGGQAGAEWGIRATPTFLFFLEGKKIHELKGANAPELRSQVDLLLYQAFPPHPHTSLPLPVVEALSTNPILFTQPPAYDNLLNKLSSFIDASSPSHQVLEAKEQIITRRTMSLYLSARFPSDRNASPPKGLSASPQLISSWSASTRTITQALPTAQVFPLVDLWRLALLDEAVGTWCATNPSAINPVHIFLRKADEALSASQSEARNFILIALRMLANAFACSVLAKDLLSAAGQRVAATKVIVSSLLHADTAVRTAAASLAFNVAAFLQKGRVDKIRGASATDNEVEEDGEWEVELVSAVLEALSNEGQSEEAVHRLTAALAFLLRLSPVYESQLVPFLEVLHAKDTLMVKLAAGGCGEKGVQKKEVRKLVEEVAEKLCP